MDAYTAHLRAGKAEVTLRVCSGQGCLRKVADDVRFCDECKPSPKPESDGIVSHTSGYDEELDRLRKSPRWQRTSHAIIRAQPMCARCNDHLSDLTDHIVPAREAIAQARNSGQYLDRWAGYFLRSNLQGLCRPCHYLKTVEDKTHVGPWTNVIAAERLAPKRRWTF